MIKKEYNLEKRTFNFAVEVRDFLFLLKPYKNESNIIYIRQLIRSSSSIGANYIEAVECLSNKDYLMRLKICRKEAKETLYWLQLVTIPDGLKLELKVLVDECTEIMKIFGSIITKINNNEANSPL